MRTRKLRQFYKCFEDDNNCRAARTFQRLSVTTVHSRKGTRCGKDCIALGKPKNIVFSRSEINALERILNRHLQSVEVVTYNRFLYSGRKFSTLSYSEKYRRNNSIVFLTDNKCGIITKFCICKFKCICVNDVCSCRRDDVCLVIVQMLRPSRKSMKLHDKDSGDLLSFLYQCEKSSLYQAVSPSCILDKGFIAKFDTYEAAFKIPQFELD